MQTPSKRRKQVYIYLGYGFSLGLLILLLKWLEYKYFANSLSVAFYLGIVALLFTLLGIWAGLKYKGKQKKEISQSIDFNKVDSLGISKREYQVLELIAQGLSNQEIADQLFISLPTVKTHVSNLFVKLSVSRRTQAVQAAKALKIL